MSSLENLAKSVVANLLLEAKVKICFQQSSVGGYWVNSWLKTFSILMTLSVIVLIKLLKMDILSVWLHKGKMTGVIVVGTKLQK